MQIEFRQLSANDGMDVYEMLQEIPKYENGFINGVHGKTFEEFERWLIENDDASKGIGLEDWMVPQTIYWLYIDGTPAGMGKLRHRLTDKLKEEGGHAGYAVRASLRNRGFGKLMLRLLIEQARELKIDRLLITIQNDNTPSIKVALANGGKISKVNEQRHYIWVDC